MEAPPAPATYVDEDRALCEHHVTLLPRAWRRNPDARGTRGGTCLTP